VVEDFLEVARRESKPHNRPVTNTPWQRRIRRAELLISQHPFAAEILGFYIHVAGFQETVQRQLDRVCGASRASAEARQDSSTTFPLPLDMPDLLAPFARFLSLIEAQAPAHFAQVARNLRHEPSSSWTDLLNHCWSLPDEPSAPQEFLALAFLQPCAEFVRSRSLVALQSYTLALCPLCRRKPASAVLRQQGDGGRRSLLCGFCLTEWEFRRVVCPGCGEQDHAKLPVYTAESFPHIRVECCDTCRTYLKSIDLTKNGLADPLVDELAFVPLDLWAQERGYAKLRPNLLGM
jgi:FdhE protein